MIDASEIAARRAARQAEAAASAPAPASIIANETEPMEGNSAAQ